MIEKYAYSTWREYFVVEKNVFHFKNKSFKYCVHISFFMT